MPWLSPECARGEPLTTESDVYSFCCLVWKTCMEKMPRSKMDSTQIQRLWTDVCSYGKDSVHGHMLSPLDPPAIPMHISSFLKLGLQPEMSERRDMDLQEIYLMLRLQAAVLSHSQQRKENDVMNPHAWDAVKEQMKAQNNKRTTPAITPPRPPPPPPPPAKQQRCNDATIVLDLTNQHQMEERIEEEDEGLDTTPTNTP